MQKEKKVLLGLKLPTDPRWVNIVEKDLEEILTDHAYCEQKAASNAISIIVKFPEYPEVVKEMVRICHEEMAHFDQVHDEILQRGFSLGKERKDEYVNELLGFLKKGNSKAGQLVEKLLFAGMIEARSCERFRVLSEHIEDQELALFYRELMASEAGHHTMFLKLARKFGIPAGIDVDARWEEFLQFEASLIQRYEQSARIHG
jgi:tRNA-(ms[2]io[6]A)-hydroxylase